MKIQELLEAADAPVVPENVKGMEDSIDSIAKMLFGLHAGPVKDAKRSKDPIFYGVAHKKSIFTDPNGKSLYLTFDNSTDSGEFEINSLAPLQIERGSAQDKHILAQYRKHGVRSKKKTNYIAVGDQIYLREVHLGQDINIGTVKMVRSLIKILGNQTEDDEPTKDETPPPPKKEEPKKKEK